MPNLVVNFTGLCLFVRHPGDSQIDVRFVTQPEAAGGHHHDHKNHFPIMAIPSAAWQTIMPASGGGVLAGRGAGRLVHMYAYDSIDFRIDGVAPAGPVSVTRLAALPSPPTTPANWTDFRFFLDAADVFPGAQFDPAMADAVAPKGKLRLNGGTLSGAPPINQLGDLPYVWRDAMGNEIKKPTNFVTDAVSYRIPFVNDVEVLLNSTAVVNTISLASTTDIVVWVSHDPFDLSLRPNDCPRTIDHLSSLAACFHSVPAHPPTIYRASTLCPDSCTCNGLAVRLP